MIKLTNKIFIIACILMLTLVACQDDPTASTPTPDDGPLLTGLGDMPKSLATVEITDTPVANEPTQPPVTPSPTLTPEPPEPTFTPTANVGIYVGEVDELGTPIVENYAPVPVPFNIGSGGAIVGGTDGVFIATPPPADQVTPIAGSQQFDTSNCPVPINESFANVWNNNPVLQSTLGCPLNEGLGIFLVSQQFERGELIWRDNRQIYGFPSTGQYYELQDTWQEGQPESDPAFNPPEGYIQPIRGFGNVWRNNQQLRDSLGWAITPEEQYPSYWQEFQGGYMVIGDDLRIYAVVPSQSRFYGPYAR